MNTSRRLRWDDVMCFHDAAWLRVGDGWKHYVLSGFCDWTNYLRASVIGNAH